MFRPAGNTVGTPTDGCSIAFVPVDAIIRERKKIGRLMLLFSVGFFFLGLCLSGIGVDIFWSESALDHWKFVDSAAVISLSAGVKSLFGI